MDLRHAMRTTPASRDYTGEDLPDDVLYELLDSARFAPTGGNRQAWRVIVIRDATTKERIAELYELGGREYAAFDRAGLVPFVASEASEAMSGRYPVDLEAARQQPGRPTQTHLATAPVLLVLLLDSTVVPAVDVGLGRLPLCAGASIYPFAHNILLAARAAGYGGHLSTLLARQEPALRELLAIPDHYLLGTMMPLGRPRREITRLRRAPVESFTTVGSFAGPALGPPA